MANYTVSITNGIGSQSMKSGTYNVSATTARGYDASTLSPTTYTASNQTGQGVFTIAATGTLTFNVNETGAQGGTPITSGTIVMTDSMGNTEYGSAVNIDSSGNAVFNNVPYGETGTPFTLYFKQLSTDESHNFSTEVITVQMINQTQVEYIQNTLIAIQSFTITDANYTGLPIPEATLQFNDEN